MIMYEIQYEFSPGNFECYLVLSVILRAVITVKPLSNWHWYIIYDVKINKIKIK